MIPESSTLLVIVLHRGAEELHTKVTRGLFTHTISVWHAVLLACQTRAFLFHLCEEKDSTG